MRKLLSSLIIILIILLIMWVATSWYFGTKAEKEFKLLLQNSSKLVGKRFVRTELLDYKRTASGAKAILGLSSDYPLLNESLGDLQLQVKLLNGPIFFTRTGVSVGGSRWVLTVVDDALNTLDKTAVGKAYKELFPKGLPSAVVRVDFDEKAHYVAKFGTNFSDLLVTGIFDLKTENNRGAISVKNFVVGSEPNIISAKNIQISYQHQKAITTRYKPGTASLQTSSFKIHHQKLSKPLSFGIKINSNFTLEGNALKGYLKANIQNVNSGAKLEDFPFEKVDVSMQFEGFPADALIAFSEANDNLDNLYQQAQWALEELGEVPEGQDQIWQLYDRIEESTNILSKVLEEKMKGAGSMKLHATTHYKGKSSSLEGSVRLQNKQLKISSWLSLLDGKAEVKLDDSLLKAIQKFLPITQAKFRLLLRENKVLIAQ